MQQLRLWRPAQKTTADAAGNYSLYPVNMPNVGSYTFTVQSVDAAGNATTLAKTFTRIAEVTTANLLPPDVTLTVSETTARVGDTVTATVVTATHDGQPLANEVLLINGNQVPLEPAGTATISSLSAGVFTIQVKAFDAEGNEGDATQTVTFLTPPNGQAAPVAGFDETQVTPVISLPTPIMGTANTPELLQYTLQYSIEGQNNWTTFATGTTAVVNGTLGTIDPTVMDDGFYDVRLTVEDTSGQVTTADEVYQVNGNAKVGDFTLSFQDLNLPNAGLPITVTRTYDTRTKNTSGDFGYGWSLSTSNIQVETSSVLGAGFIETETQLPATQINPLGSLAGLGGLGGLGGIGGLPGIGLPPGLGSRPAEIQYSFQNTQNDYVTIYLPNGTKEQFLMGFTGVTYSFAAPPLSTTSIFFVPVPGSGTVGTLQALTDNNVIVSPAQVGPVTFLDRSTGQVYNPTQWKYTDPAGNVFVISTTGGVQSITNVDGTSTTYTPGLIKSSDGQEVQIARDSLGRVTSITDPMGNQIKYSYDFYGNLATVTDAMGDVTRFTYDGDHTLEEVYDPLGRLGVRDEYDSDGRLIATVDAQGNRVSYDRDLPGRQETVYDRNGNPTIYYYDTQGNVTSEIDAQGNVTSSTYDARGNRLTTTNALGQTTTMTYDANNDLLTVTNASGGTTSYTYNSMGDVLSITDPKGNVTRNTYNALGQLVTVTDALGNTTSYTYDSRGNVASTTDTLGNTTTFTYDLLGDVLTVTNALGGTTSFTYDADGNQLTETQQRTDGEGNVHTITTYSTYNANNEVTKSVDAAGNATQYIRDAAGDLIETIDSDGNVVQEVQDPVEGTDTYEFPGDLKAITTTDANGNMVQSVDVNGNASTETYDSLSRLTEDTSPDGSTITYQYDALGREIATTDSLGNTTKVVYGTGTLSDGTSTATTAGNQTNQVSEVTDPNGATVQFQYDQDGNPIGITLPDGSTAQSQYNALNQETQISSDGSTVNFNYNAGGELSSVSNQAGLSATIVYDALGRIVKETDPDGGVTSFTYDQLGNVLSETDPDGNTTRWEYDNTGDVIQHTLPMGQSEYFTYNHDGKMTSHTDFDGQTTYYSYDRQLNLIETDYPDGTKVTMTYDDLGDRTSMTDGQGTTNYTYDSMRQGHGRHIP